jgi:hypothetical protein
MVTLSLRVLVSQEMRARLHFCTLGRTAGKKSAGQKDRMWYYVGAFVALVTPLDSILEGLRVQTRGLFCFTAGGSREAANSLNKE